MESKKKRTDRKGRIASFVIGAITCIAALMVVPEIRAVLNMNSSFKDSNIDSEEGERWLKFIRKHEGQKVSLDIQFSGIFKYSEYKGRPHIEFDAQDPHLILFHFACIDDPSAYMSKCHPLKTDLSRLRIRANPEVSHKYAFISPDDRYFSHYRMYEKDNVPASFVLRGDFFVEDFKQLRDSTAIVDLLPLPIQ